MKSCSKSAFRSNLVVAIINILYLDDLLQGQVSLFCSGLLSAVPEGRLLRKLVVGESDCISVGHVANVLLQGVGERVRGLILERRGCEGGLTSLRVNDSTLLVSLVVALLDE